MTLRKTLLAATMLAVPVAAMAQPVQPAVNPYPTGPYPVTGLYIGGGLGYNYLASVSVSNIGNANLSGNGGFVGLASVGWGFGNGFRVEVEGSYRNTHQRLTSAPGLTGGAQNQTYGGMFNGYYDFNYVAPWIVPYVGIGVGYQETNLGGTIANNGGGAGGNFSNPNGSEGGFAAQAMLGAGFPIPQVPGLAFTAEFRFMGVLEHETFHGTHFGPAPLFPANYHLQNQYNYAGLIGLRYNFGVAPPPPPPAPVAAPAPAPARTYLVFFDWDKYNLTDRARQIIADAAQASTRVQVTRIDVSGHTDTTGSAAYNQALSVRRARAVQAELVRDGVPENIITVAGYGFTRPLVPTGPGVREPQNRRVEIVLH